MPFGTRQECFGQDMRVQRVGGRMESVLRRESLWARAGEWVENGRGQYVITALIVINAAILGLETSPTVVAAVGPVLSIVDRIILAVFVLELVLRIGYRRGAFFTDGWSIFDLLVVAIALVPASGNLSVLRALRVLRVLRLVKMVPRLKRIVQALLSSIPGVGMILVLMGILFYVGAVITTRLFGAEFPEWFGTIGASLYSLFQIMTLESWSAGIVRPVMAEYPYAWAFFIPFILATSFTILNLVVAVIVDALQTVQADEPEATGRGPEEASAAADEALAEELRLLRREVGELREMLRIQTGAGRGG